MIVTKSEWLQFFQPFFITKILYVCLKKSRLLIRLFNVFFLLWKEGSHRQVIFVCRAVCIPLSIWWLTQGQHVLVLYDSTRTKTHWYHWTVVLLGWWNSELPRGYRHTGPVSFTSFYHSHATSGMSFQMHVLGLLEDKLKRDFVKKC